MACTSPIAAYQAVRGNPPSFLGKAKQLNHDAEGMLLLPCQKCRGCLMNKSKEWALRCQLELHQHEYAAFTTLTYNDETLPPTLDRDDLAGFLKRLRSNAALPIRFFGCGEYGEKGGRPHYHAILFGLNARDHKHQRAISTSWKLGHVHTVPVTPGAVNYVAGYTQKKAGQYGSSRRQTSVDPETGEVLSEYQPPFIQMSRRPGIGGDARKHTASWKEYAIYQGVKMSVPRFYHEAWKQQATEEEIEAVHMQRKEKAQQANTTLQQLTAQEKIYEQRHASTAARRKKM